MASLKSERLFLEIKSLLNEECVPTKIGILDALGHMETLRKPVHRYDVSRN